MQKKEQAQAIGNTLLYSGTLLVLGFSALALRGNIHLEQWANNVLGTVLAAIALVMLTTIVYKANKK